MYSELRDTRSLGFDLSTKHNARNLNTVFANCRQTMPSNRLPFFSPTLLQIDFRWSPLELKPLKHLRIAQPFPLYTIQL